jgi:hypothetical protein
MTPFYNILDYEKDMTTQRGCYVHGARILVTMMINTHIPGCHESEISYFSEFDFQWRLSGKVNDLKKAIGRGEGRKNGEKYTEEKIMSYIDSIHHHHQLSVMELGLLLTRYGLTCLFKSLPLFLLPVGE